MKKLIQGIIEFQQKHQKTYCEKYAQLALGQKPDALFVACSDSRVVPNLFASTDPGDLFVVRNVGNIVPTYQQDKNNCSDSSEAAAIDFSLLELGVKDIIVCGHSECGAVHALMGGTDKLSIHLKNWLNKGKEALSNSTFEPNSELSPHNQLSQINVLQQLEHLKTYPEIQKRIEAKELNLHGWWFDIVTADVFAYSESAKDFLPIKVPG